MFLARILLFIIIPGHNYCWPYRTGHKVGQIFKLVGTPNNIQSGLIIREVPKNIFYYL